MKKIITVLFFVSSLVFGQVKILGIMDGPLSGGVPKFAELLITQDNTDLSGWKLIYYANGSITPNTAVTNLSGIYDAGQYLYVIYNASTGSAGVDAFKSWFGLNETQYDALNTFVGAAPNVNGDDAIAVNNGTSDVDVFGEIGTDGTGEPWEYLDGWAYGGNSTPGVFVAEEWTYSGINALDGETLNSTADTPYPSNNSALPVELTTFTASIIDNKVELNWETATEINNYGFEVERASARTATGKSWEKIGFVEGHGNSNSPKFYSYTDKKIEASGNYNYRLKQIDIDGTFEYSDVVEANLGAPESFELDQNYPNPFNPLTSIRFNLPTDSNVKLTVFNVLGQEVAELINENITAGYHSVNFDGSSLNSGIYFYQLETNNFTQIRKMMLVK